jgi:dienelactone hydrolase
LPEPQVALLEALMAEVLLFHHAQGLTPGVRAFADELRVAGHTVHTPDLFDGRTFDSIDAGMTFIRSIGFDELRARGVRTADDLPAELVYAGFSFGEAVAQELAQTRPGARGALLFYSCIPISGEWAFGPWPDGVPVQIHGAEDDPYFAGEGDIDAAQEIVEKVADAELFVYPGDQHYFADSSLPSYDPAAAALLTRRVLEFLGRV